MTLTSGLFAWAIWIRPAAPLPAHLPLESHSGLTAVCGGASWHHTETMPFEAGVNWI